MSFALFLAAVIPSLWIVNYFRKGDRFPEPAGVVSMTFVLGILIAIPVLLLVGLLKANVDPPTDELAFFLYRAFFYAAIPEEGFKFLVLLLYCLPHDQFDEPMDGLVYGVTVSLGFAALENILYVADGGWSLAITRAVTAVPLHGLNGAIMGYFIAHYSFVSRGRVKWLLLALAVPIVIHGAWNFSIYSARLIGPWILLAMPAILAVQYVSVKRSWLHFDRIQRQGNWRSPADHRT